MTPIFSGWRSGIARCALAVLSFASTSSVYAGSTTDSFQWLESPRDPAALKWATAQTAATKAELSAKPIYPLLESQLTDLLKANEQPPGYALLGEKIVRFRRDTAHPHGILEVAPRVGDGKALSWYTALDVDALRASEKKTYELHWNSPQKLCLPPAYDHCLVMLSPGGSDEVELRELDLTHGQFVKNGFAVAASRTDAAWLDANTLLISHTLSHEPRTVAGWPTTVHLWKRGTPLESAPVVVRAEPTDAILQLAAAGTGPNRHGIVTRAIDYSTFELKVVGVDGSVSSVDLPRRLKPFGLATATGRHLVVQLAEQAVIAGHTEPAETVIAWDTDPGIAASKRASVIFEPHDGDRINDLFHGFAATEKRALFVVERRLINRVVSASFDGTTWKTHDEVSGSAGVSLQLVAGNPTGEDMVLARTGYITPTHVEWLQPGKPSQTLFEQKAAFDATKFTVDIKSTPAGGGVSIDYYLLRPKQPSHPGPAPTLMTGYGAFGITLSPGYLDFDVGGPALTLWLDRGGSLVVPLIRGGGERGEAWHQAAIREKRQVSYDDFITVAQALIKSGYTDARHLGVFGLSNGGLLSATVSIERPDLFGAVVSDVPLTDMLRFPKMGMGGAWMDEYGNPDDPRMRKVLLSYSPFHNIKPKVSYPPFLVTASTQDDRVGPGHARKLAARLEEVGAKTYYIEDSEGGHGVSDALNRPELMALRMTFLIDRLMAPHGESKGAR